jgi:transcriptional regulator with XRE-family HTH domain
VSAIGEKVGDRLRAIRRQKGLSLQEVEARSGQEFKASVLGAYERGERALSVARLVRLAELYDVPPDQLLPRDGDGEVDISDAAMAFEDGFTIDLVALADVHDPDAEALGRYVSRIQVQRQDFNGRYLTIRRDDFRVLAAAFGNGDEEFSARLEALGLRARV